MTHDTHTAFVTRLANEIRQRIADLPEIDDGFVDYLVAGAIERRCDCDEARALEHWARKARNLAPRGWVRVEADDAEVAR